MNINQSRFAGEKIVIADDDEVIVELAGLLLKNHGFKTFTAKNGEECLQLVEKHRPALVLLDYMMPVMSGYEALKIISRQFPDTYVVMFTGKGSEEVAVELMKAGAADYLCKPFAGHSLKERIDAVLSLRQVEVENRGLLQERELLQDEIQQWNSKLQQRVREKNSELELAHKEILQSEKLATLGHISAGMAHEIRNPLNTINLFSQILLAAEGINGENKKYVFKITQEVEKIDAILRQMLASSPEESARQNRVDVAEILDKVLNESQLLINRQRVAIELNDNSTLSLIQADFLEIEQVFTNLISNALYEMPDGGTLAIALKSDAENLYVTVSDSGSGISKENLSRIFDPFFTTKEKGTGFGLSVALRIVESCGGKIQIESPSESGACFLIELPLLPSLVH